MIKPWCRKFRHCIRCGQNDHPHSSRGLCRRCYMRDYLPKYWKTPHTPRPTAGSHFKEANRLFELGWNLTEIARALGITKEGVRHHVRINPTANQQNVRRTCQRCRKKYLGGRRTQLCELCTSGRRAKLTRSERVALSRGTQKRRTLAASGTVQR